MKKHRTLILILVVVLVGGAIVANKIKASQEPIVPIAEHQSGNPAAAVTLVEYADFQCPACAAYDPVVRQLETEFKDRVRFVFKNFPLSMHQNGVPSAQAAEAAGLQGKFFEMKDMLYAKQREWSDSIGPKNVFADYARSLGLNVDQFKKDYGSRSVKNKIESDRAEGLALELRGTPSFVLNGRLIENPQSYEAFRELINTELARVQ